MYYQGALSTREALYVSRAQQKIASITAKAAEQSSRNDLDEYLPQLAVELQYSIEVLTSTTLDWSEDDKQMMMDYYTVVGGLIVYAFRSVVFNPPALSENGNWVTHPELNIEVNILNEYDAYLLSLINAEITNRIEGDNNLLTLINNLSVDAVLTDDITAGVAVGSIEIGQEFTAGTTLQAVWEALLGASASVNDFTFDSYSEFIEVGQNLVITEFTYTPSNSPTGLVINDSKGLLVNEPVSGGSLTGNWQYNWSIGETLTWTLSGDNVPDQVITVHRIYPTYYGKEATADDNPPTITEAKILAGSKTLQDNSTKTTVTPDTASNEQGFIAVHKAQSGADYTHWFVDYVNSSDISSGEFIEKNADVIVSGQTYSVYRWGYRSPLTDTITLSRTWEKP